MTYPLHLHLVGKKVVVIGAGRVATRRVLELVKANALVTVIAPEIGSVISGLAAENKIDVIQRNYFVGDLLGSWLVHIATNDALTNEQVAKDASELHIWAIQADNALETDASTPAVGRVDDIVLSVTSGDPGRSAAYKNQIIEQLSQGLLHERPRRLKENGSVVLIGAGPGDPGLITIRGYRALLDADVVVFDRLAPAVLLDNLHPDIELIDASKSPGNHVLTQNEINDVLVSRAKEGLRVVRLKGGDPFVFGRGSEEVNACVQADIQVEVIPGISSSIAAPSAAGIPVTHRGLSTGFTVISGHQIDDLKGVVTSGLTTVVLMGVATLANLVAEFTKHGASQSTPIAIIENAYLPEQKTLTSTLGDVVHDAHLAKVTNPAVIVIGEVVHAISPEILSEVTK